MDPSELHLGLHPPPGEVGATEHDRESNQSHSDYDARELEVLFEADAIHRRKSSLADASVSRRPLTNVRHHTSCFVHSLLEEQRKAGIAAAAAEQEAASGLHRQNDKDPDDGHDADRAQSRLLTKKQLSDMAFGIRELAKKLAHIRLKLSVKNVFVLTKAHDEDLIGYTKDLTEWLLRNGEYNVYVENTLEENALFDAKSIVSKDPSFSKRVKYWSNELCHKRPQTFDIVVSLGGDGTVLYASWLFQRIVPPVISFAMGSLGFLTKFDYDSHAHTLTTAFRDGISVSLRLRFEGTVMRAQQRSGPGKRDLIEELVGEECDDNHTHRPDGTHNILNDVVLDRGPNPTMSTLEVFGDDKYFTSVQADGVCVATPTGSTAYNLAAGGSLCHPDNPVILMTAICAHTLSFRPIILPDTMVLRIGVPYDARASSWASFDGRERVELSPGDYVTISASRFPFPSVLPLNPRNEDWIDSISRTLNWNSRQKQKSFKEWGQGK